MIVIVTLFMGYAEVSPLLLLACVKALFFVCGGKNIIERVLKYCFTVCHGNSFFILPSSPKSRSNTAWEFLSLVRLVDFRLFQFKGQDTEPTYNTLPFAKQNIGIYQT